MEGINIIDFNRLRKDWRSGAEYFSAMTSGSTGKPKLISLSRKEIEASARRTLSYFSITSDSLLYSCVGAQYIGGKMMLFRAEIAGCDFDFEIPSNRPLEKFDRQKTVSLLAVVPSQMVYIIDNKDNLPRIDNIIVGGSPIPYSLRNRIAESGLNAYETYGMTETCSHIAIRKITSDPQRFMPLPGVSVNTDGRDCLVISIDDISKTVTTNDIARVYGDNSFEILGRYDDVIITGGCKVNPAELEDMLSGHFHSQVAISSIPDPKWGEKVVAVATSEPKDMTEFESYISTLQPHQRPKALAITDRLPLTFNGKLNRRQLSDCFVFSTKIIFLNRN